MTEWSEFVYQALPMRVTFGPGRSAHLADELDVLGVRRVLVLSTPGHEEFATRLAAPLGDRVAGIFAGARMHVPVEVVAEAAKAAAEADADAYLAVGGGSTVGLGKALALRTALPVVAVPTTYSGSEMTPIWGLTENGAKRTGRDPSVLPRSVVYDPDLTLTLPVDLSVTSGLNSLAHAVEALYAPDASPMTSLMAREGAAAMLDALPRIVAAPKDGAARSRGRAGGGGGGGGGGGAPPWGGPPRAAPPAGGGGAGAPRRRTARHGRGRSTAPGCAGRSSASPRCRCTTSSATSSVDPWTCRTRRRTRWSSPTCWLTTHRGRPRRRPR